MATANPTTLTTPRARYEALVEQCENLSFDQAVKRFNYLGFSVTKRFPDGGYDTFIDEVWTKKGLKQFLALLEFHNAYLIPDDDEVSPETSLTGESAHGSLSEAARDAHVLTLASLVEPFQLDGMDVNVMANRIHSSIQTAISALDEGTGPDVMSAAEVHETPDIGLYDDVLNHLREVASVADLMLGAANHGGFEISESTIEGAASLLYYRTLPLIEKLEKSNG